MTRDCLDELLVNDEEDDDDWRRMMTMGGRRSESLEMRASRRGIEMKKSLVFVWLF